MSEKISYEGSEVTDRIPGLYEVGESVTSYVGGLNGELAAIGPLFSHIDDQLSATIYKTYTKQMGMVGDTMAGLGAAVDVHGVRMNAAAGDHQNAEDTATDTSQWGTHR